MLMNDLPLLSLDDKAPRADAQRNRRRLMETAQKLFESGQFEAATMSEIAQLAGVGKGTLYRHFSDKSDLCHALLDQAMREFQARTLFHLHQTETPKQKLLWFLGEVLRYVDRHMLLLSEAAEQGRKARAQMLNHPAHIWWRQTIVGLLEQIPYQGDTNYAADMLYIMLDVQTLQFQREIRGYSLERMIAALHHVANQLIQPLA
jgi:AcrR family transcriptional regulator